MGPAFQEPVDSIQILEADEIRCLWCKLPWAMHPRDPEGNYFCLQKRGTSEALKDVIP